MTVTVLKKSFDLIELPGEMGGIKFILDVSQAVLSKDSKGRESLELTIACRAVGSEGQPLETGQEKTLCVS